MTHTERESLQVTDRVWTGLSTQSEQSSTSLTDPALIINLQDVHTQQEESRLRTRSVHQNTRNPPGNMLNFALQVDDPADPTRSKFNFNKRTKVLPAKQTYSTGGAKLNCFILWVV